MNPNQTVVPTGTITADKLKDTSTLILPKARADITTQGATDYIANVTNANKIQSAQERLQADETAKRNLAETGKNTSLNEILGFQTDVANVETGIDRTAENEARKLNDEYTNQIEAEQIATRRAVEALQKNNTQGLFGGGLQDELNRIQQVSLSKQADLGILQNASARRYDTARAIADKVREAKLAPLQMKLENAKFFYTENKANFNKADERVYSEMVKKADQELKKETEYQTSITELKKNVAQYAGSNAQGVLSQLSKLNSKDPKAMDKALQIAGQYGGDVLERKLKQVQIAKVYQDIAKTKNDIAMDRQANGTGVTGNAIQVAQQSKYKPQLDVILGSGKFTKEQKASFINSVAQGKDPVAVIKNQAIQILGTEGKDVRNLEKAKAQVQNIDSLLKQYYAKGGKTSYLSGTTEKAINKLGTLTDPELVSIGVGLQSAIQAYRNAVSGTAYGIQEGAEINSVFPGINKSQGLNNAIVKGRLNAFDVDIDAGYRSALGDTYDELKQSQVDPTGLFKNNQSKGTPENDPGGIR